MSFRASKSGFGYEVQKKMEAVRFCQRRITLYLDQILDHYLYSYTVPDRQGNAIAACTQK
jgi:hypothetical protein